VLLLQCGPVLGGWLVCRALFVLVEGQRTPAALRDVAEYFQIVLALFTFAMTVLLPLIAGASLMRQFKRNRRQKRRLVLLSIAAVLINIGMLFFVLARQ
jgi:EamA domain-containing membrane protein RarD